MDYNTVCITFYVLYVYIKRSENSNCATHFVLNLYYIQLCILNTLLTSNAVNQWCIYSKICVFWCNWKVNCLFLWLHAWLLNLIITITLVVTSWESNAWFWVCITSVSLCYPCSRLGNQPNANDADREKVLLSHDVTTSSSEMSFISDMLQ